MVTVFSCIFDALAHRQAFYNGPSHTVTFYHVFHLHDLLMCPDSPVGHIMKGSDNSLHSDLPQHSEFYGVVGAEPSPGLFHMTDLIRTTSCM